MKLSLVALIGAVSAYTDLDVATNMENFGKMFGVDQCDTWYIDPENSDLELAYRNNARTYMGQLDSNGDALFNLIKGKPQGEGAFDEIIDGGNEFYENNWTVSKVIKDSKQYIKLFLDSKITQIYGNSQTKPTLNEVFADQSEIMFRIDNLLANTDKILSGFGYTDLVVDLAEE